MTASIRQVRTADRDAVYEICLLTADAGDDGTHLYSDPAMPGHVWAGPYVAFEPEQGFVVTDPDDQAIGYVLAAADSRSFEQRLERDWWPPLRERYPQEEPNAAPGRTGDRIVTYLIHHPPTADPALVDAYPSHLHIDLLPAAQGRGDGRRLIERLCASLRAAGSPGVHLGVARRNERAIGFYRALGFEALIDDERHVVFGLRLT